MEDPDTPINPIPLQMLKQEFLLGARVECVSAPDTGDLFLWGPDVQLEKTQVLVKITRSVNGEVLASTIGVYQNVDLVPENAPAGAVYDGRRNMIWVPASEGTLVNVTNYYYYIDATTAKIVKKVPFDDFPLAYAQYDPVGDKLVGLAFEGVELDGNVSYALRYANPVSLAIEETFPRLTEWCVPGLIGSLNINAQEGYFLIFENPFGPCNKNNGTLDGYLAEINLNNGRLDARVKICRFNGSPQNSDCPLDLLFYLPPP
jgi:hypothetical protein